MTAYDADVIAGFIAAINRHDVAALADSMAEDHTFIDTRCTSVSGRNEMAATWKEYFRNIRADPASGRRLGRSGGRAGCRGGRQGHLIYRERLHGIHRRDLG